MLNAADAPVYYVPATGLYCSEDCVRADFRGNIPGNLNAFTRAEAKAEFEDLDDCSCTNCGESFAESH